MSRSSKLELLAPAGSVEAFFAAVEAGADAIYCGLKEFSARARAKNFSLAEMERLSAYAHANGRLIYVTLNTLIKETELPALLDVLAGLAACRVDGLIIQDLGVWRLAREHFPELPLHASTQMAIHNSAGVKTVERMGFTRAVLARELSLHEIRAIAEQTTLELEHFVHGALCYSISGLCLFSSYLTGKSGNRGRCVQPCRRRYHLGDKPGFYFSPNDFQALELIPELAAAGVMSFKIEGRMKNAEYVSAVTTAYRKVMDARPAQRKQAVKEALEHLVHAHGRPGTIGFLKGKPAGDLLDPTQKGGIGVVVGTIDRVRGRNVLFTCADTVHVGDRLRIQPRSDLAGASFTVKELSVGKRKRKRANTGEVARVSLPFDKKYRPGDQIYKIGSGKTFTLSEEACRRRLAAAPPARTFAVNPHVICGENLLRVRATAAGCELEREYEAEMFKAERSPLSRETLQRAFAQTGHAELVLAEFLTDELPPVVIRPSRLKEIRRDFFGRLLENIKKTQVRSMNERLELAIGALLSAREPQAVPCRKPTVMIGRPRDLTILEDVRVGDVILALTRELVDAVAKDQERIDAHRERIIWDIPAIVYDGQLPWTQSTLNRLLADGFTSFRLNNLAHFELLNGLKKHNAQVRPLAGLWLYTLNSQAIQALVHLGAEQCTLSMEDDAQNIKELLARDLALPASIIAYAPIPLTTSRIPMRNIPAGTTLRADNGTELRINRASGLCVTSADRDFSLLSHLQELRQAGCNDFIIDLTNAGWASERGEEVLEGFAREGNIEGEVFFNFVRGLDCATLRASMEEDK